MTTGQNPLHRIRIAEMSRTGRVITLTTDFGLEDGYVGTVKGVILSINPDVTLVDFTHQVSPQDVFDAAFVLGTSYQYFRSDTIHVVVVDPGVGSERAALAVRTPRGVFVGPDNGVLTWPILDELGTAASSRSGYVAVPDGSSVKAVHLTESRFWLRNPSRTFHARDIFGPVAAYLSLGTSMESLGQEARDVRVLPVPVPRWRSSGRLDGEVLRVDHFGNLITNLKASDLERLGGEVTFVVAGQEIRGLSSFYGEKPGLLALIGSSGYVEIAVQNGSAAKALETGRGATVTAKKTSKDGGNA